MKAYHVFIIMPYEGLREHRYSKSEATAKKHVKELRELLITEHEEGIGYDKEELAESEHEYMSIYADNIKEGEAEIKRLRTVTFKNCIENKPPSMTIHNYISWDFIKVVK